MSAADQVKAFIEPILNGWRVQFGRWVDDSRSARYAVLRPAGGGQAELLRYPAFTLVLIGADGDAPSVVMAAADQLIEAMRSGSGALVSLLPGEPVYMPTSDGRVVLEIALSAITE